MYQDTGLSRAWRSPRQSICFARASDYSSRLPDNAEGLAGEAWNGTNETHGIGWEQLLNEVARTRARYAILDLTGVEAMDTSTASHMLRLVASLRLLGAEGILTDIRPSIAHTMVGLGLDMDRVRTLANLREGFVSAWSR